jgi:hypothetical protein
VQSVPYSSTSVSNSKFNESVPSDIKAHNEIYGQAPKTEAAFKKDVGGGSNQPVTASIKNGTNFPVFDSAKTSTTDGAMYTSSPPPTAVMFKASTDPSNNKASTSSNMENRNTMSAMSPITMCFERMLGAGT